MITLPKELLNYPDKHRSLHLKGLTVIESCLYEPQMTDNAYTNEHEIIHVFQGNLMIRTKTSVVNVHAGETVYIPKATYFEFVKTSPQSPENTLHQSYQSILLFLRDDFLREFVRNHFTSFPTHQDFPSHRSCFSVIPQNKLITGFMKSLLPYFGSDLEGNTDLLHLKTTEFLLNLTTLQPHTASRILFAAHQTPKQDLPRLMESHFWKNLSLHEFATLSGRSLSTFKRDFAEIFHVPPAKWLKQRRLEFAYHLLIQGNKDVSEVCYEAGFENLSHFSSAFKKQFGCAPGSLKHLTTNRATIE
ncbi:MAG: helix-turn-helix transcriptional regulator [Ignavibacteria bacterium]|nr:helix-turn-helix transcriptional regulator [Ignavibacteria bacterium]